MDKDYKHGVLLDSFADDLSAQDGRFRILSLTGGGYRGLFSAHIAKALEEKAEKPLNQCFDLICGTSIGGIIATGLAYGVPAEKLVTKLQSHGRNIFAKRRRRKLVGLFTSSYPVEPLKIAIKETLAGDGEERSFADELFSTCESNPCKLMLVSLDHSSATPAIFGTTGFSYNQPENITIMDALLSTSAAPTYFQPHKLNKSNVYLDGGLVANAPDLLAITRALKSAHISLSDIHMVSIGTAGGSPASAPKMSINPGKIPWLISHNLFDFTLHCQEQLAVLQAKDMLGKRYVRINPTPSAKQSDFIALDKANEKASGTLETLSDSAILNLSSEDKNKLKKLNFHF